jgi:RNA polymerase sigma-70 factor (ECF subfamily)
MAHGPAAGLEFLDELAEVPELHGYHLLPAARARFLEDLERFDEAAQAYRSALDLVGNDVERAYLRNRLAAVDAERAQRLDQKDPP